MTFIGLHDYESTTKHDGNFAYAIINKRILAGQKTIIGEKFKAVNYKRINDISFETEIVFGIITIDTLQEKFVIALDKGSATSVNNHIHEVLDRLKVNANRNNQQPAVSVADELKTFKELLDIGVITQDEFDAKKKQLLEYKLCKVRNICTVRVSGFFVSDRHSLDTNLLKLFR